MEDLYNKSPHQPVFAAMNAAGCVVCHSNHAVRRATTDLLVGPNAVCSQCHEAASTGGLAASTMGGEIRKLAAALDRSDAILKQAASSGMEVSEAVLRQNDARDSLVKARVAVHAFQPEAVEKPAAEGLKIAAQTYQAGGQAMKERDRRRAGLGVSLLAIAATLAGLWLAIRRLEKPGAQGG
jgi:hypothetical protein